MRTVVILLGLLSLCLLAACAPGINEQVDIPNSQGIVCGFWRGLWHGIIAPVTFIVSLFKHDVQMYEVHNNGAWYNVGYLLGMNVALGGHTARRSWRRK